MKQIFLLFFAVFSLANSFAATSQPKKPEPGNTKTENSGKSNAGEKKVTNNPPGKEQDINNQKLRRFSAPDSIEFYGPLSWKPVLLY